MTSIFGLKNDSPIVLDYFERFYADVFWPEIDRREINTIISLGDFMDRRKYVNYNTLARVHTMFIEPLLEREIEFIHILGNHDCYYKNTNQVNSFDLLFSRQHDLLWLIASPTEIEFDGRQIAFIPWITEENAQECAKFIDNTSAEYCFGHFELSGFEVMRGVVMEKGLDPRALKKFKKVYSGHYHCKQENGNIHYLGTPYQMTMSDIDERKGIHFLDTNTMDIEFFENPLRLFFRFEYDEDDWEAKLVDLAAKNSLEGSYIRVGVYNKKADSTFDTFLETLYSYNPGDVVILDSNYSLPLITEDEDIPDDIQTQDILTILMSEVQRGFMKKTPPENHTKDDLVGVLTRIYDEALEM